MVPSESFSLRVAIDAPRNGLAALLTKHDLTRVLVGMILQGLAGRFNLDEPATHRCLRVRLARLRAAETAIGPGFGFDTHHADTFPRRARVLDGLSGDQS